jgi:uncharacterized RDD family membrane protein YckC
MYIKSVGYRILAFIIDLFIVLVIGLILHPLIGFGTLESTGTSFDFSMNLYESTIIFTVYFALFEFLLYGKSPGKLVFKLEVRQVNMKPFEKRHMFLIRGLVKGLLIIASILSFLIVMLNENRQSIHDLIVKSIVVRKVKAQEVVEESSL